MSSIDKPPDFTGGDHVYKLFGPFDLEHHGIFIDASWSDNKNAWILNIADFYKISNKKSSSVIHSGMCSSLIKRVKGGSGFQVNEYVVDDSNGPWKKVHYLVSDSDEPEIVISRVVFLIEHPHYVPRYSLLHANCESIAVWCKTGYFCTKQVLDILSKAKKEGDAVSTFVRKKAYEAVVWCLVPIIAAGESILDCIKTYVVDAKTKHVTNKCNHHTKELNYAFKFAPILERKTRA